MRKTFTKNGFTLIEMMIVVSIIALLVTAGAVVYSKILASSRNAKRQADLESVKSSLVLYRTDMGYYPPTASFNWGTMAPITSYISTINMKGPQGDLYTYVAGPGGCSGTTCKTFTICATLENVTPNSYCVNNP